MRPGSTWVELGCTKTMLTQWGKQRPLIFKAMQIKYVNIDGAHCRDPTGRSNQCAWLPVKIHPLVYKMTALNSEKVAVCDARHLCTFRKDSQVSSITPLENGFIVSRVHMEQDRCNDLAFKNPWLL